MFGLKIYDVLVIDEKDDFTKIIQILAMSAIDAQNIAETKGYFVKDVVIGL